MLKVPQEIMDLCGNITIEPVDLPVHPTERWEPKTMPIQRIIVHHMASEAPLVNQAKYHINTHGWPGLSYHLVVSGDQLLEVNSPEMFTYHAADNNYDSVSISIHGDLSKRSLTETERKLLYAGILTLKRLYGVETVIGHNQVNATSCPCISMDQVRGDIAKLELLLKSANDPRKIMDMCYRGTNQHSYLFNQYRDDPEGNKWLEPYLLKMHEITKEMGMYF
jgi:hypothetical protein